MKKITRRNFLIVTGAASLAAALTACGGGSDSTAPASSGAASTPAKPIKIGILQDITGATSSLGKSVEQGAIAAIEELNAAGGIDGAAIEYKTYDTKGDVTEAVNSYITAVTVDNVDLIIGPPVANIANAIKTTSEDYDVPVLGFALDPTCQLKEDGTPYKNMFCLQPSATAQGAIMAAFALKNGLKSFGIIYNQENAYSVSLLNPFIDRLAEDSITIDEKLIVPYGAADTDYKTLLQPIVAAKVDGIYVPNYTAQLVAIATACKELGYEGKLVCGLDAAPNFNDIYGQDCSNIYFINNIDIYEAETAAIIEKVGDGVSAINKYFLGYDAIMLVKQCVETAGIENLADSVANTKGFKCLTGTLSMDPDTHMPDGMGMFMYTYDGSKPVMLEEFAG